MGFFLPVPPLAGGATEKIWHRLAAQLAEAGHEVTVISRRWPGLPNRETIGRLTHIRIRGTRHTSLLPLNLMLDLWWGLRAALRLPRADVVICNTVSLPAFAGWLRPDAGKVAVVLGRMPKGQTRAYGGVDLILATSAAVARRAHAENPRLAERIRVLPNPIDWGRHSAASRQSDSPDLVTIGFVGRIHPEKGVGLLLAAAARLAAEADLPRWRLLLVGPTAVAQGGGGEEYAASLRQEAERGLAGRIVIHGPEFDPAKLAALYGSIDIFCYPSLAEGGETFGVAVAEAMAAGCAPVVSMLDCFAEIVRDGETGVVFDHRAPDNAIRLSDAIARLMRAPGLRRQIARRAQDEVRRLDYPRMAGQLEAELSAAAGGGHAASRGAGGR